MYHHYEQKKVQDTPNESHTHHDGAKRMHSGESKKKARSDERRGEKSYVRREQKDSRDESKGMERSKKARAAYEKARKTSPLGEGKRFKTLSKSVAVEYERKGKSPKEAARIAGAIAAKAGRAKYGAKKMGQLAAIGRKR